MLKSRRNAIVLAALLLMTALASACDEKKNPTGGDYCSENPDNCVQTPE